MPKKLFPLFILLFAFTTAYSQQDVPRFDSNLVEAPRGDMRFDKVEIEASFPGGLAGWKNYLMSHLRANVPLKEKAPAGNYTVMVKFIVSKNGSISEITPETRHGHGMEEEVIRIIKKGPRWFPARQGGRAVNAYRRQPVTFVVPK